jgi:hypothetical protein
MHFALVFMAFRIGFWHTEFLSLAAARLFAAGARDGTDFSIL